MDDRFMKERPVFPLLISMALPMVISMLVNSLYNIVDSYFVARISEDAMAALSLVFPIQNLINAVTIGFGIGVNAVIAYHLGANELERADRAASQGLTLSLIHGLVLAAGCIFLMPRFCRCTAIRRLWSIWACAMPRWPLPSRRSFPLACSMKRSFRLWAACG